MALTIAGGGLTNRSLGNVDRGAQGLNRNTASHLSKRVYVFDQRYAVRVYQYADNLWIAVGEFLGQQLRTVGRTAQKAARAWKKAATEKRLFGE